MLLSPEEVCRYHAEGYIVPTCRLPAAALAEMRQAYNRLLADNPDISSDFMLAHHLEVPGAQGMRGSRQWLEFATQPALLDMAAQLVGEDLILWGTTIFGKPGRGGKETPWHQDGDYYPIRPLETSTISPSTMPPRRTAVCV